MVLGRKCSGCCSRMLSCPSLSFLWDSWSFLSTYPLPKHPSTPTTGWRCIESTATPFVSCDTIDCIGNCGICLETEGECSYSSLYSCFLVSSLASFVVCLHFMSLSLFLPFLLLFSPSPSLSSSLLSVSFARFWSSTIIPNTRKKQDRKTWRSALVSADFGFVSCSLLHFHCSFVSLSLFPCSLCSLFVLSFWHSFSL